MTLRHLGPLALALLVSGVCTIRPAGTCEVGFDGFHPEEVTLVLTAGDQQLTIGVTPHYETLQPNGPDCPPVCEHAVVTVGLLSEAG